MAKKPSAAKAAAATKPASGKEDKPGPKGKNGSGSSSSDKDKVAPEPQAKAKRQPVRKRSPIMKKSCRKAGSPGKPARDTRFRPGLSGNPKGRPRKERSLLRHLEAELDVEMQVTENGEVFRLTKRQVLAKSMVNNALQGDQKALASLLRVLPLEKGDGNEEHAAVPLETVLRFLLRKGGDADVDEGDDGGEE